MRRWIYKRLEAVMDHIVGGIALAGVLAVAGTLAVILGAAGKRTHGGGSPTVPVRRANHAQVTGSPQSRLTEEVEGALQRHFRKLIRGEYAAAWTDIVGEARKGKSESRWIDDERTSHLEVSNLSIEARMSGGGEAVATIKRWRTYETGTCKAWHGYWRLVRSSGRWKIAYAGLEEPPSPCGR